MDNNQPQSTPIQLLSAMLAEMTRRADEAERQLSKEKERADSLLKDWVNDRRTLEEAEAKLAEEIKAHQRTREMLDAALDKKKGAKK